MNNNLTVKNSFKAFWQQSWKKMLLFLAVFGPATITAMADNDATGVATYSISGAQLGYPILFLLLIITLLLAITQEMGMRLTLVTRRGLADIIREKYGVRAALFMFAALFIANIGTIIADLAAIKATAGMLNLPAIPAVIVILVIAFLVITRGDYKATQTLMLVACLFFFVYIFSAVKSSPDWGLALSNLLYPHGVQLTPAYAWSYLIIGMGVLATVNQMIEPEQAVTLLEKLEFEALYERELVEQASWRLTSAGSEVVNEGTMRPPVVTILGHVDGPRFKNTAARDGHFGLAGEGALDADMQLVARRDDGFLDTDINLVRRIRRVGRLFPSRRETDAGRGLALRIVEDKAEIAPFDRLA